MRKILWVSASLLAIVAMTAPTTHAGSISFAAMLENSSVPAPAASESQPAFELDSLETNTVAQDFSGASATVNGLPTQPSINLTPVGIMVASSSVTVVPEPGTWVLMGLGVLGLLAARKRFRRS